MKKNQVIIHSSTVQLQDTVANAHGGGEGGMGEGGMGEGKHSSSPPSEAED